jgi:hypothetical protein
VGDEIGGRLRRSAPREVVWAGAGDPPHLADAQRDQAAVRKTPQARGDINMVVDQVHDGVRQNEPDVHIGVGPQELQHDRQDVQLAEHDRRGDQQFAARRPVLAGRGALGFFQIVQDAAARLDEGLAGIGQQQLAAGAHDHLRAQVRLQLRHLPADGRQRHAERTRGCGQAATVDGGDERADRVEPVHGNPSIRRKQGNQI